jgi:hypothetical protein
VKTAAAGRSVRERLLTAFPTLNIRKQEAMTKVLVMFALLVVLSACHAGFGISDSGQHPTYVATDSFGSAIAQGSIGTVGGERLGIE